MGYQRLLKGHHGLDDWASNLLPIEIGVIHPHFFILQTLSKVSNGSLHDSLAASSSPPSLSVSILSSLMCFLSPTFFVMLGCALPASISLPISFPPLFPLPLPPSSPLSCSPSPLPSLLCQYRPSIERHGDILNNATN